MEDIEVKWQSHVAFTVQLLRSDPFPDLILNWLTPRGQIQVKTIEVTRSTTPKVYRIKFVDPKSAKELSDKKAIGPYRILYCVDRTIVYVGAIINKDRDSYPYSMHNINEILSRFKEYKKRNRQKKQKEK